jgi:GTP-binding protein
VRDARAIEPEPEPFVVLRPLEEGFRIQRDDDGAWRVSGRNAERVVAMADLTNIEAIEYVQDRLRRMGVERALARAGAREGDVVRVGPVELEYVDGGPA